MDEIYFDVQATAPLDPRVREVMLTWMGERFGNPHSVQHAAGRRAEAAVEAARAEVAAAIGAEPRELVFTSGATEANNMAVKGAARFHKDKRPHLVVSAIEHKCVLECAKHLERDGHEVSIVPVSKDGLVDPDDVAKVISEKTALVSVMLVNNEIGTVQPLKEIAALCRSVGALCHSDAAQALGKLPIDVEALGLDLLSLSSHKAYGPMGMGALYLRRRPRARIEPLFDGGGQERTLRSGTVPVALTVGFGRAAAIAAEEVAQESGRLKALSERFLSQVTEAFPDTAVNGSRVQRVPGNLNIRVSGVLALDLMNAMPDVMISTGSACSSASVEPSYVLRALGLDETAAGQSLRIGFGRFTTPEEIDEGARRFIKAITQLRTKAKQARTQ